MEEYIEVLNNICKKMQTMSDEALREMSYGLHRYFINQIDNMSIDEETKKRLIVLHHNNLLYENLLINLIQRDKA